MTRRPVLLLLLFLAASVLFVIANRGAYRGYFQDDEIDNLSWAPVISSTDYLRGLISPRRQQGNFRPVGHAYFHVMGRNFGLDFPKYVIPLHAIHLLNVVLVFGVARKLSASTLAAGAGALFFAFHMAAFDVYWKPMYVFDLLCATFSLICLLLYSYRRYVLSFVAMWLAYKSKELAVMLPLVLLLYEYWFGDRRWLRLAPFFAVSLLFGIQGVVGNPEAAGEYAFHFTPAALEKTVRFYESRILLLPFAGFLLPLLAWFVRDRRVWFGLAAMFLFFVPLAFLPGRMFPAYTYLPLTGAALALTGIVRPHRRALVALFFALWIPWNYFHLRLNRRSALTIAEENRRYISSLGAFIKSAPDTEAFVYDGRPFTFNPWGISGAIRYFTGRNSVEVLNIEAEGATEKLHGAASVALLAWDSQSRTLDVVPPRNGRDAAFISMDRRTPVWQLDKGWYGLETQFRWIQPLATARLYRPAEARDFELTVNVGDALLELSGPPVVQVLLDGKRIGEQRFTEPGWHTKRWRIPPAAPGTARVEFRVSPGYQPSSSEPRKLGVAIVSFGFLPKEAS